MISASTLPLLVECAASAAPDVWLEPDKSGPKAKIGNAVHKLAELHLSRERIDQADVCRDAGISGADEDTVAALWSELAAWLEVHTIGQPELAYAYDPATGISRLIGKRIGRQYDKHGRKPNEIAGTADIVHLSDEGLIVTDIKTGASMADTYAWQMYTLGLMVARASGHSSVTVRILQVSEVEAAVTWEERLGPERLDGIAAELLRVAIESQDSRVRRPGSHCDARYCRARKRCDAYQAWKSGA